MDVLLIAVAGTLDLDIFRKHASMPPLGLLYLASYLKENTGIQSDVIDLGVEARSREAFQQLLLDKQPSVVGVSVAFDHIPTALEVARAVKESLPGTTVVFGGPYATFATPERFAAHRDVDFLVRREGEVTFAELVRHRLALPGAKPLADIDGIVYKEHGRVEETLDREFIEDLDSLPIPDREPLRHLITSPGYHMPFSVSTSRGCPGHCVFCSTRAFWGPRVRFRSPESVVNEIDLLVRDFGATGFHVVDDTFTARPEAVIRFCGLLKEHAPDILWSCESRADVATPELLQSMYDAGCRTVQFGIESGVQEVLDALRKNVTVEQIENAVRMATEIGIKVNGSYIVGHYVDTIDTMKATIAFIRRLQKEYGLEGFASANTPFPGTPQYENRDAWGIKVHTQDWDKLSIARSHISTRNFSQEDLRAVYAFATDVAQD